MVRRLRLHAGLPAKEIKTMNAPIADRTLWDCLGNKCRVEMHCTGENVFEVYFHDFNDATPRRTTGTLGICNSCVDAWLENKRKAGFVEQLPSHDPEAWIA